MFPEFICPLCLTPLLFDGVDQLDCPQDGTTYQRVDDIWRMLPPERLAHYQTFLQDYETIRQAEGRGSHTPDYYQRLPFDDSSEAWRIRSQSYRVFLNLIENKNLQDPPLPEGEGPGVRAILDLGAGNGWLSNRLAQLGHQVTAVDLTINTFDGLGCHIYYNHPFVPVQAEFDTLPFEDLSFDLAVFNASFHYSTDYTVTLAEALRVSPYVVIIDTPIYRNPSSGRHMVEERHTAFEAQYGFRSDALPHQNYLTFQQLNDLCKDLHLTCTLHWSIPAWRRTLRRVKSLLKDQREPAKFPVIELTNISQ